MITKDEYEDLLNESYAPITLPDGAVYLMGTVIKRVDPIRFHMMYTEWCQYLEHGWRRENDCRSEELS